MLSTDEWSFVQVIPDDAVEEHLEKLLDNKSPEDLTESEESELNSLLGTDKGKYYNIQRLSFFFKREMTISIGFIY